MKKIVLLRALLFAFFVGTILTSQSQTTDTYATAGTYTWTCPAGVTSVTVECWGGGGGGGFGRATNGAAGGGGGGGAYASSVITVTPGVSYTVVVGAGGSGGAANGTTGTAGLNSSFNTSSVIAVGGSFGAGVATNTSGTGGAGGAAASCTGITTWSGGAGSNGVSGTGGAGGGGGAAASATADGASATSTSTGAIGTNPSPNLGSGGSGVNANAGGAGTLYGGGGAGAHRNAGGNKAGGAGAAGAVLLTYTIPACSAIPTPGNTNADVSSVCGSGSVNLSLENQTSGTGVTYQWQSSSDNINWSNVSGTSTTYSATVSSDTYFQCLVTCPGFTVASSAPKMIIAATPTVLSTTPASRCGTGVVTLNGTASAGTTLSWYDVATGGTALSTGNSYTTPVLNSTKDYYVESGISNQSAIYVGPTSPTAEGGTIGTQTITWDVNFTVLASTTLKSIDIFPVASGESGQLTVRAGTGTGGAVLGTINYTTSVSGGTTPQTISINVALAPGSYSVYTDVLPASGLRRNTTNASYPYTSSIANITGNGFSTAYYMCLYNWQFASSCVSARTTVTATITTPPALTMSSSTTDLCSGSASSAVTLTAGGSDYDTYSWSPSSGVGGDAVNGWTFSPTTNTTYTLTSSQSSGSLCANTASVAVTVKPLPAPVSITPNGATVCPNEVQSLASNGGTTNGTLINESFPTATVPSPWQTIIGAGDALATSNTANAGGAAYEMKFTGNSQSTNIIDRLYAGPFNTAGYTSLTLSWKNYLDHYSSTYPYSVAVETSSDGVNWHPTSWITNPVTADQLASTQTVTINTADVGSSTFYVSFKMAGLTFGAFYWYIDDVLLTGTQTTTMTWSPTATLFTDAAATIPYTGNPTTVYAQTANTQTYTATATGLNGCSTSSEVTVTISCALPVTLTRFNGAKEGNKNVLRWITSSESNNNGFEVQRSTDGVQYTSIGYVQSLAIGGNSANTLNYLFTDNSYSGMVQYYRLRQVDNNGRSQLSNVVMIREPNPIALSIVDVYPNPATSIVNVVMSAPASDKATAMITDVLGNIVSSKQVVLQKGNNLVSFNIGELAAGSYFVKLICNNNCPKAVAKFVKK